MQEPVDRGEVANYADLARLAHVTRSRITQIMELLLLAPDIQEDLLFLPLSNGGRAVIHERMVRPIIAVVDWRRQGECGRGSGPCTRLMWRLSPRHFVRTVRPHLTCP